MKTRAKQLLDPPAAEPTPIPPPWDTGDVAFVVYWHPFPMPDDPKAGSWSVMVGMIVAVGRLVCFETSNPTSPHGGSIDPVTLPSPNRWTTPDRLFASQEEAETAARALPRPS